VPNAALLGGFAAVSGRISLASVAAAIRDTFSGAIADGNVAAAAEAFKHVTDEVREAGHA
jgi:pyruvate ferredoxin oxidoreductase gamma subunit